MTLPLFACMGTLKQRGSNYRRIHDDLRLQFDRDKILRMKTKRQRTRARSIRFRQTAILS